MHYSTRLRARSSGKPAATGIQPAVAEGAASAPPPKTYSSVYFYTSTKIKRQTAIFSIYPIYFWKIKDAGKRIGTALYELSMHAERIFI